MLLSRPSSWPFDCRRHSKCKVPMTFTIFCLLIMLALFMPPSHGGVIKKRETFITEQTTTAATRPNYDPDIGTTITTLLSAPGELRSNDSSSSPITKLVLQPVVGKLTPMTTTVTESSKEYMLNEIALNETKKLLKTSTGAEIKETDVHVVLENVNKTDVADGKEAEIVIELTTTPTPPLSLSQGVQEFGNDLNLKPQQDFNRTQVPLGTTTTTTESNQAKPTTTPSSSSKENRIETNQSEGVKSQTTTTNLNIKDNSLESNHISDDSKKPRQTNQEVVTTEMPIKTDDSIFSISFNNTSLNLSPTEKQPSINNPEMVSLGSVKTNNHTVNIQDGLDRELLKEVSNDLPERTTTTEKALANLKTTVEPSEEVNKLDYGRSMFKTQKEPEETSTLVLPLGDNSTTDSPPPLHIANNIDLPDNNAKRDKFINDNSTNAQQMNLPSSSEVWSLAGLKSLPSSSALNATMETAPKHNAAAEAIQQQMEKSPFNQTHLNQGQSEKFLLDWSHIMMDKDLAAATTRTSFQETDNNEVISNNEDSTATPAPRVAAAELDNTNILWPETSTTTVPTITANSTILSTMAAAFGEADNNESDKQEIDTTTTTTAVSVDADFVNGFRETTTSTTALLAEIQPTTAVTTSSSLPLLTSPTSLTDLNEINLTLNKTTTTQPPTTADNATQFPEQRENNNNDDEKQQHSGSYVNITESETERVYETAVIANAVDSSTSTSPTPSTNVEQISSEQAATTVSTLETSKRNVSATVGEFSEKSQKYSEKSDDNETIPSLKEEKKETSELFDTATTTIEPPLITTYKPKFFEIPYPYTTANSGDDSTSSTTSTTTTPPPLTTEANKIRIAEVVDQNGNEIEQKQSINVETTTITPPTTTTAAALDASGSFNNISSTNKTHLNEQVLLEATTPAPTETTTTAATIIPTTNGTSSEKTTSSSKDNEATHDNDEIINKAKEEQEYQLEKTITTQATPKDREDHHSDGGEVEGKDEQVRNTTIVSGSTTPATTTPPLISETTSEKEQQEIGIETTTTSIPNETPVVNKNENISVSFASTTPEPLTITSTATFNTTEVEKVKNEEEEETTTTKVVDTYFKFPVRVNNKKEKQPQEDTTTKEEEDKDEKNLETTTMSTTSSTTTLKATTNKEETYINLLDDSTTTTSTSTTTIPTTTTPPPPPPTTTTTTNAGIEITSKIEEIYKVIISTTTEAIPTTPRLTSDEIEEESSKENLTTTFRSSIHHNTSDETTTMLPPPTTTIIATADIGGKSLPPLNTIMAGGNSGNIYPKNSDTSSGETDVNVIIAISVSVIGVVALILLVAFLYLMRKRQKQTSYSQRCRPVSLDEYAIDNGSVGGSMRKGSALRSSKRTYGNLAFDDPSLRHNAMGVHELAKFAVEKLRIFEEFRDVPQITAREDEVPPGCEDKNRYANVLPLPETRVVLQRLNDDDKTEYINANYATGPKDAPNYYIACQAPLDTTVEDFWRMIWEQQSRVIIQATDLIENGVEKCAEYLPPSVTLDNHTTFGDFQVTLQNREVKDKYAISTVLLKHTGENNATRELTHYWYKWPETGVPVEEAPIIAMLLEARSSLISYAIEQANEDKEKSSTATLKSAEEGTAAAITTNGGGSSSAGKEDGNASVNGVGGNGEINGNISMVPLKKTARNQGPLTIHCSPGTGRTGTIIACDIAIRSLETPKRTVDIPQIVYHVRRGRASAVLTKEQYEFIYKVANMYAAKITNPTNYN